jgi:hypothetical protein
LTNQFLARSGFFSIRAARPLFRPYNVRLTREAVAPIRPAWKRRANGGSGAAFAHAKGVTATLSRVESFCYTAFPYHLNRSHSPLLGFSSYLRFFCGAFNSLIGSFRFAKVATNDSFFGFSIFAAKPLSLFAGARQLSPVFCAPQLQIAALRTRAVVANLRCSF